MSFNYHAYLRTQVWKRFRKVVLAFWGWRCIICYSSDRVELHHRTYERLGDEELQDVLPLCHRCHSLIGGYLPNPPEESNWSQIATGTLGIGAPPPDPTNDTPAIPTAV